MDNGEQVNTLKQLIELALDNGWGMFGHKVEGNCRGEPIFSYKLHSGLHLGAQLQITVRDFGGSENYFYYLEKIIFDVDFAKAIFGEEDEWHTTLCTCNGMDFHIFGPDVHRPSCARASASRGFKYHIREYAPMGNEERLEYLRKWMEGG